MREGFLSIPFTAVSWYQEWDQAYIRLPQDNFLGGMGVVYF
jgi:hypothetical protein